MARGVGPSSRERGREKEEEVEGGSKRQRELWGGREKRNSAPKNLIH